MYSSDNQFTARMAGGCLHESPRDWVETDRKLLEQEQVEEPLDAREASLTEFDDYLHGLPVEELQAALDGLREYRESLASQSIDIGWHRLTE